jgi:hypothetical protein
MITTTFFGPGGFDPDRPDGNVIAVEVTEASAGAAPLAAEEKLEALRTALNDMAGTVTVAGLLAVLRSALDA